MTSLSDVRPQVRPVAGLVSELVVAHLSRAEREQESELAEQQPAADTPAKG